MSTDTLPVIQLELQVLDFAALLPELDLDGFSQSDTIIERFWQYVDIRSASDCWAWTGAKTGYRANHPGYGALYVGRVHGKTAIRSNAHRLSWVITNQQPIPVGYQVCHTCDNGICVNPSHLFLGTPADNTADMIHKGRNAPTLAAITKVTPDIIVEARRLYRDEGLSCPEIGAKFGLSGAGIYHHIKDCVNSGHRNRRSSKLTKQQVLDICQRHAAGGVTMTVLAHEFGVDLSYISYIVNGKRRQSVQP